MPETLQRVWTLAEANAAVPRVEEMLTECRAIKDELHAARDQVEDLRILWGERIHDPSCPDHREFRGHLGRLQECQGRLRDALERFPAQGIHLKDIEQGLVDFVALRGQEAVYLCYRSGEGRVGHWHPLHGGFAARRPVPDLDGLAP